MMRLSISNIAWDRQEDDYIYGLMNEYHYAGLEIAPSRVISDNPYANQEKAYSWSLDILETYGLKISSMQSILYGIKENIFDCKGRQFLTNYLKGAINFAKSIGCYNLVFGCPVNRRIPDTISKNDAEIIAKTFFYELGEYAKKQNTIIALEPVNSCYNTNFLNTTRETLEFIDCVESDNIKLNLDVGSLIQSNEGLDVLEGHENKINHVHISEPGLDVIKKRDIHIELSRLLKRIDYSGYISIEMKNTNSIAEVKRAIKYLFELFNFEE